MVGEGERYTFGEFVVDRTRFEVRRRGDVVRLEPRGFDVLAYLVAHRGRVVTKEELLDEVWGDRFVSESALSSQIRHVRRVLGDDGRSQGYVRTAHGRGYQFVADVAVEDDGAPGERGGGRGSHHNLPAERTPLFGRDAAIEEVIGLLDRHRLVTLLGLGGAGKTRLATAVGRAVVPAFDDGVWFVDLVPADDSRSVELAVARSCGLGLAAGPVAPQLVSLLADRELLVIVDNCEHVAAPLAATVEQLLDGTERLRVLATSRIPLGMAGERRVAVERLSAGDDPSSPAVALFVATAERFDVAVGDEDHAVIRQICDRLDGLPLAIELAAGQLRVLTPKEVLARLDDPLALLERSRTRGDRHASLHDVLASAWQMLDADDRRVLGRLAAFPGTAEVLAGEAVCADLDVPFVTTLARLVDRSLVAAIRTDPPAVRLADAVRQFAREHTDASANAERHAEWCLAQAGPDPAGHLFDFALAAWCTRHVDDVRAAEQHLVARGRPADAAVLTTATALAVHCDAGSHAADVLGRVARHLERVDDPALVARLHCTGALAAMAARSPVAITQHGRAALAAARHAGDPALEAVALVLESWSTVFADPAAALEMVERASQLAGDVGATAERDHADSYRAFHLAMVRRYAEALDQADRVIAGLGDGPITHGPFVAIVAATALRALDDPAGASRWLDPLLSLPSTVEPMWANEILASVVHASAGRTELAAELAGRVRARSERAGRSCFPDLLLPPAMVAYRRGDDERASRWLAAIRHAGRPTQSFQITVAYRRLREAVPIGDHAASGDSVDATGDEALKWLATTAA
jgi:predicted ATPase/DNA-binding winged helix-turn-helix (wHTH) protein